MKVTIPVRKTINETIELPQLPYYSCAYGTIFYVITSGQTVMQVTPKQITYWRSNDDYYGEYLVSAYQAEQCAKDDFDNAYAKTLEGIKAVVNPASGQAGINYMFDPNAPQAAGQTTEQAEQNAQESASQDQAMEATQESAEEGGTEG
jgi:hypothetical protein